MPVVTRSLSKSAEKEKEKEKKKEKESSESGKVKSKEGGEVEDGEHEDDEHNESDKADGQNYEETEEKKVNKTCYDCFFNFKKWNAIFKLWFLMQEPKKIMMCTENSEQWLKLWFVFQEPKKITMCAENSECPSGQICKDNHCNNECDVHDHCKQENHKCINNKCVEGDAKLDKVLGKAYYENWFSRER